MPCYYAPPRSVARLKTIAAQIEAMKLDKLCGLGNAADARKMVRLLDSMEVKLTDDGNPDCPVKCRWIVEPDERGEGGIIETQEEAKGLFVADRKAPEKNIRPWVTPDGTMEDAEGTHDEVPAEVLARWAARGNHSQGVIPVDKCQKLLAAIAELPEGHEDGDLLKAELAIKPLGLLLSEKSAVLVACARVKGDCIPEKFRPAVLQAFGVNPLADAIQQRKREAIIDDVNEKAGEVLGLAGEGLARG